MGEENFKLFINFINEKDALPISLNSTQILLKQRKLMQNMITSSKEKFKQIMSALIDIAGLIVEAQVTAD